MKALLFVYMIFCGGHSFSQGAGTMSTVHLQIKPKFGMAALHKDSSYQVSKENKIIFTQVKMFISDIALAQNIGKETRGSGGTNGIYLLDLLGAGNNSECQFEIITGEYSDLRFVIGVPRELNHSDPTMAPAPLNIGKGDMYWSWNSGYIFLLMEGRMIENDSQSFHFAIGGDFNAMPLSFGNLFDPRPLIRVQQNMTTDIIIDFDLQKIFLNDNNTSYDLGIEQNRLVHGGSNALKLRNNILKAFTFRSSALRK
jgi:hypothetical protein